MKTSVASLAAGSESADRQCSSGAQLVLRPAGSSWPFAVGPASVDPSRVSPIDQ